MKLRTLLAASLSDWMTDVFETGHSAPNYAIALAVTVYLNLRSSILALRTATDFNNIFARYSAGAIFSSTGTTSTTSTVCNLACRTIPQFAFFEI
jgi:hypothetical protein